MKKVTTNITLNQILFILFIFCLASLMAFYLGAKFGPEVLDLSDKKAKMDDPLLPDERLALEIKKLLRSKKHEFVFYEALQSKDTDLVMQPKVAESNMVKDQDLASKDMIEAVKQEIKNEANLQKELEQYKALAKSSEQKILEAQKKKVDELQSKKLAEKAVLEAKLKSQRLAQKKLAEKKAKEIALQKAQQKKIAQQKKKAAQLKAQKLAAQKKAELALQEKKAEKKVVVKKVHFLTVKTAEPTVVASRTWDSSEFPVKKIPVIKKEKTLKPAYRLQLGSYQQKSKAALDQKSWKKRGYNVDLVKLPGKGKKGGYRLRMGGYSSLSDAISAQQTVSKKFKKPIRIVDLR